MLSTFGGVLQTSLHSGTDQRLTAVLGDTGPCPSACCMSLSLAKPKSELFALRSRSGGATADTNSALTLLTPLVLISSFSPSLRQSGDGAREDTREDAREDAREDVRDAASELGLLLAGDMGEFPLELEGQDTGVDGVKGLCLAASFRSSSWKRIAAQAVPRSVTRGTDLVLWPTDCSSGPSMQPGHVEGVITDLVGDIPAWKSRFMSLRSSRKDSRLLGLERDMHAGREKGSFPLVLPSLPRPTVPVLNPLSRLSIPPRASTRVHTCTKRSAKA